MSDDLRPAYMALIRRELHLPPGSDALLELRVRLDPADTKAKPPYRAPGIVRLRRGVKRLEMGKTPAETLEQFAEDLRFLQLFKADEPLLPREAMQKLLSDVMNSPPIRNAASSPGQAEPDEKVVPFRPKKPRTGGQS